MRSVARAGIGFFKLDRRHTDGLFKGADQVGRVAESAALCDKGDGMIGCPQKFDGVIDAYFFQICKEFAVEEQMKDAHGVILRPVAVADFRRNDKHVAGNGGEVFVFDVVAAVPFDDDIHLIEIMRVHIQRKLAVVEVGEAVAKQKIFIVQIECVRQSVFAEGRSVGAPCQQHHLVV